MSQVNQFWIKVNESGPLAEQFDQLMAKGEDVPASEIVAFAQQNEFSFTARELRTYLATATGVELSEDQLDAVVGGRNEVVEAVFKFFRPNPTDDTTEQIGIISF